LNQNANPVPHRGLRDRLSQRNLQTELMDDPNLPQDQHDRALRGLTTIHRFSGLVNRFWKALLPILRQSQSGPTNPTNRLKIADVGCGDGYLLRQLCAKATTAGFDVDWIGYDFSTTACQLAADKARAAGVDIRFNQVDILADEIPEKVDVVLNSLFLHHFESAQVQTIITKFRDATTQAFIVEDLRRTVLGYCLAWSCGRLLSRSPIVHYDSVVSVEGAFSIAEVQEILAAADIQNTAITRRWPERFVLTYHHH
jgi:2-polyprenyl-3-methyl-5-hydroxy-6-metoxy-1,4-benzoquinol methylase